MQPQLLQPCAHATNSKSRARRASHPAERTSIDDAFDRELPETAEPEAPPSSSELARPSDLSRDRRAGGLGEPRAWQARWRGRTAMRRPAKRISAELARRVATRAACGEGV